MSRLRNSPGTNVAEREAKANAERRARNGQQLGKALADGQLAKEELAEAKNAAAHALASEQQALDQARVAKATLAQVQTAFPDAIQHAKSSTVVTLTGKQAEALDDHGVDSFLRLNTVRRELAHVLAENARLRDEGDAAKKQLDDAVIEKLLRDIA